MITVFDLIETSDVERAKLSWEEVGCFLSEQPGFIEVSLLETFETVHPQGDYKLTSVGRWESQEAFESARALVRQNPRLAGVLANTPITFTPFIGEMNDGHSTAEGIVGHDHMILIDVIRVETERREGYAAMWRQAKNYMKDKDGYVSAHLYQSLDKDSPIQFINMPEWNSPVHFTGALKTPEFFAIVDDYKENFALYLSRKVRTLLPNARSFKEAV